MIERERGTWQGRLCTIISWPRIGRSCEIRDDFGFTWTVRKRDVAKLRADDERKTFSVG